MEFTPLNRGLRERVYNYMRPHQSPGDLTRFEHPGKSPVNLKDAGEAFSILSANSQPPGESRPETPTGADSARGN